jgi:hypothetical protein
VSVGTYRGRAPRAKWLQIELLLGATEHLVETEGLRNLASFEVPLQPLDKAVFLRTRVQIKTHPSGDRFLGTGKPRQPRCCVVGGGDV